MLDKRMFVTDKEKEKLEENYNMIFPNLIVVDENIRRIVCALNTFEGVSTIHCCESHPELGMDDSFYITFGLTEKGFETIQKLCFDLRDKLLPYYTVGYITVDTLPVLSFKSRKMVRDNKDLRRIIPSVHITTKTKNARIKKLFIDALSDLVFSNNELRGHSNNVALEKHEDALKEQYGKFDVSIERLFEGDNWKQMSSIVNIDETTTREHCYNFFNKLPERTRFSAARQGFSHDWFVNEALQFIKYNLEWRTDIER